VDGIGLASGLKASCGISSFEIPGSFNMELVISVAILNRFRTRLF
jgi:hypothetical protein